MIIITHSRVVERYEATVAGQKSVPNPTYREGVKEGRKEVRSG